MFNNDFKRRIAYEVLIFLGLLALVLLIMRVWPLLLLVILGIFVAALRLLFMRAKKVEIIMPSVDPPTVPAPETEKGILRCAFGLIQRRITEEVEALHPSARWQWLTPNAMAAIEKDEQVAIILNGAGGYRKATALIHNLAFRGLVFESASVKSDSEPPRETPIPDPDEDDAVDSVGELEADDESEAGEQVNYEYLAFEWVDAHLLQLSERGNEAIAQGENTLLIPIAELPDKDSWPGICKQLMDNDFTDAVADEDGILVSLQQ